MTVSAIPEFERASGHPGHPSPVPSVDADSGATFDLVRVVATASEARQRVLDLVSQHTPATGGYVELVGVIRRDANSRTGADTVTVTIAGEPVADLPRYAVPGIDIVRGDAREVPVLIFAPQPSADAPVEVWVWLGLGPAEWPWA